MNVPSSWLYPASLAEAKQAQLLMAEKISLIDDFTALQYVGGMDVSMNLYDPAQLIYASTVVLNTNNNFLVETSSVAEKQSFPYIPGFLGFREAPALINAYNKLNIKPDLLLIDGHGISHPRKLGIASHIGALLDIPTIGVAKSILIGTPQGTLGLKAGASIPLVWNDQTIAMMVRTKQRANPLIISSGHKISLERAVNVVLNFIKGYRLPEPTRQAHLAANAFRKQQQFITTASSYAKNTTSNRLN